MSGRKRHPDFPCMNCKGPTEVLRAMPRPRLSVMKRIRRCRICGCVQHTTQPLGLLTPRQQQPFGVGKRK